MIKFKVIPVNCSCQSGKVRSIKDSKLICLSCGHLFIDNLKILKEDYIESKQVSKEYLKFLVKPKSEIDLAIDSIIMKYRHKYETILSEPKKKIKKPKNPRPYFLQFPKQIKELEVNRKINSLGFYRLTKEGQ